MLSCRFGLVERFQHNPREETLKPVLGTSVLAKDCSYIPRAPVETLTPNPGWLPERRNQICGKTPLNTTCGKFSWLNLLHIPCIFVVAGILMLNTALRWRD